MSKKWELLKSSAGRALAAGVLTASSALSAIDPATAQDSEGATTRDGSLTMIVVTAQRRAETLQTVPISAEVATGDFIAKANLNSLVELADLKPSIRVVEGGRNHELYIRGTGSGESQSFDQSVGTFIDDIYHGRSRSSVGAFLDLERVEILKGPQTTYFGNNAIAGAFSVVTKKPTDEFGGWLRGLISPRSGKTSGEHGGQYAIEGAINAPITDDFALRVAATYNGQDGYNYNIVTDERGMNEERMAVRTTLRYNPDEKLDIILKGEWSKVEAEPGLFARYANCPPPERFGPPAGFCGVALSTGTPLGVENHQFASNEGARRELENYETLLNINYDLGFATLTSTTGYYEFEFDYAQDTDSTPLELLTVHAPEEFRQFSQELRLSSETGGKIEYLAGLYFQSEDLDVTQTGNFFFLSPVLESIPPFAPLVPFLPLSQEIQASQKTKSYSAFAAVTYNVMDDLSLTGSLRGSIVDKKFDWMLDYGTATQSFGGFAPLPESLMPLAEALGLGSTGMVAIDRTDEDLMPGARLQYDGLDNTMFYFSFTRGFKAGGFNIADTTADPANFGFEPENVNAYEVGLKSELFDRKLRLNLALFRNDFSDLQVSVSAFSSEGGFTNFVRNAAKSRAQGLELEAEWAVNSYFRLSGALTVLDSEYVTYLGAEPTEDQKLAFVLLDPVNNDPDDTPRQNLSGQRTPFAPDVSGNITGTFTLPVFSDFELITQGSVIFSTDYQLTASNDPLTVQPGYARIDARITFRPQDGPWAFDIIGKNLNDETIRTFSTIAPTTFGSLLEHRQPYRNIAFQFRYEF